MSHPARGPVGTTGFDGKAISAGRRRRWRVRGMSLTEAAE